MDGHCLTNEQILAFSTALFQAERSQATVEKYLRSVQAFSLFLDGQPVTKDTVLAWKKHLQREENYSPSTVNASLAALNYLFNFLGWADCRTHYLKIQRRLFRETGRELERADYEKLIAAALGLGHFFIVTVVRGGEMFVRHRRNLGVGWGLRCAEKEGPDGNADGQKRDHGGENEVGFRATIHRQNFLSSAVKFILPHGAKFSNSCRKI